MNHLLKIHTRESLISSLSQIRQGRVVGLTGGVFDILHIGHIKLLKEAKDFCDILIVAVNSDASVKKFKPGRPIISGSLRLEVIASIMYVDYCFIFDEENQHSNLELIKPDIFIKGGDYSVESLKKIDGLDNLSFKPNVKIIPLASGISTSLIVEHIKSESNHPFHI